MTTTNKKKFTRLDKKLKKLKQSLTGRVPPPSSTTSTTTTTTTTTTTATSLQVVSNKFCKCPSAKNTYIKVVAEQN